MSRAFKAPTGAGGEKKGGGEIGISIVQVHPTYQASFARMRRGAPLFASREQFFSTMGRDSTGGRGEGGRASRPRFSRKIFSSINIAVVHDPGRKEEDRGGEKEEGTSTNVRFKLALFFQPQGQRGGA